MFSGEYKSNTKCVHLKSIYNDLMRGAASPILNSTANSFEEETGSVYYPRYLNIPTQIALAKQISSLENGEDAILFSSGMAAITTVLFTSLKAGDHAILPPDLYGGTYYLITSEFERAGIEYSFAASNQVKDFEREINDNTKLIYIETPSNPLLKVTDIKAISDIAKKYNLLTAIDNTFASPVNQNPITLGIDIVAHSATKYLNGHSDLVCGVVVSSGEIIKKMKPFAINHGATLNGQSCYLLERGIKTLALRVKQQNNNALELAKFLESHNKVKRVYYPGLESHPDHEVAKKQMSGFGGMLSVEFNCSKEETKIISSRLNLVKEAGSLGGVESTLCFPAETSHAKMQPDEREKAGIADNLVRISVGIEDIEDIIQDFSQALS